MRSPAYVGKTKPAGRQAPLFPLKIEGKGGVEKIYMSFLIINSGSSSLKFKLFNKNLNEKASGIVEKIGQKGSFFVFKKGKGEIKIETNIANHKQALALVLDILQKYKFDLNKVKKIGHRVVHGGTEFVKPTLINNSVLKKLKKYNKLAPLHNPYNLLGIEICLKNFPQAKNYAVFDTAFYSTLPDYVYNYAIPPKYKFRKFGFHGISHEYVATQVARKLKKTLSKLNLITCHLGSGCSITAIKNGKAIDTSMGFTPLEGLMMSTRSGDLDPAIPLRLSESGMKAAEVEKMLNFDSGWYGLTGLKDMRDILVACGYKIENYKTKKFSLQQKKQAVLALQMFVYRIQKYIGSYLAVLGKVDAIVFTAGIGERNVLIRQMIMKGFEAKTLVVKTDEELAICNKILYEINF